MKSAVAAVVGVVSAVMDGFIRSNDTPANAFNGYHATNVTVSKQVKQHHVVNFNHSDFPDASDWSNPSDLTLRHPSSLITYTRSLDLDNQAIPFLIIGNHARLFIQLR